MVLDITLLLPLLSDILLPVKASFSIILYLTCLHMLGDVNHLELLDFIILM